MSIDFFKQISYQCLFDLATSEGINASSRNEAYGCIFGRDSAITTLKLLSVYAKTKDESILRMCKITLLTLARLQGKRENIESGEQPGKIIHEFRRDNYERLIKREKPWFIYSDGTLRNYDSLDATPLTLIAWFRYWQVTGDRTFLHDILPQIEHALQWIINAGDKDNDYFLEYEFLPQRKFGGLLVQSWTDSVDSVQYADGRFPVYPIAPIEIQAYAWLALKLWGGYFKSVQSDLSGYLLRRADQMKLLFNTAFIHSTHSGPYGVQALDGHKQPISTVTANPLLCLWASTSENGRPESILMDEYIPQLIKRAFQSDLFDRRGGIRTMSMHSPTFDPGTTSYHNGSFWPVLNGMIHEGLVIWGYETYADRLKQATLHAIEYFRTPIELYILADDGYKEFTSRWGKRGCRYQAWSAAAILDLVS